MRTFRPGPAAQLLIALTTALVLALALIGPARLLAQIEGDRGIVPLATSSDYQVNGIKVDVTGKTGAEARDAGWKLAEQEAWRKLNGPKMSPEQIDAMVSAIVVQHEEIGPRRYIATLGVAFDRGKAGQFLGPSGTEQQARSAPLLVIPVLYSGGVRQVFEVRGPWQQAWANFQSADSPIDYVRPVGAGGDSLLLTAGQPSRRSRVWWRNLLDQFGADDVLIPEAHLERQWPGGPVRGTFTARYGPDNTYLDSFTMTARSEQELPAMLDQAVQRIDGIYRNALAQGLLQPDPSRGMEQRKFDQVMAELRQQLAPQIAAQQAEKSAQTATSSPASPSPAAGQGPVSTFAIQFATPDAAAVDSALSAVRSVPGVRGAATTSIAIGGTSVMRVTAAGDLNALASALRARGWQVVVGNGALRISR
jgi:hypothetical protein